MKTQRAAAVLVAPFKESCQLSNELDGYLPSPDVSISLPSQPQLVLNPPTRLLAKFLFRDVCPTKLNQLAHHLWICSTPSHTNIPPLHNHAVHGRSIVPTEDPALHLVWTRGRIFIKPLPPYLLSHAFWTQYLQHEDTFSSEKRLVAQSALGLLRSYYHSIYHERDLRIAQQGHLNLIPEHVTWKQWSDFSASFNAICDSEVAPRYHYGKVQLSRLHWLTRIYLRGLNYYYIDGVFGESFARYYGPLLFAFGVLSVLLSAMQVGMAVEQLQSRDWTAFWSACRWFSVISLCVLALVCLFLFIAFVLKSVDELLWAVRSQYRARPRSKADMDQA